MEFSAVIDADYRVVITFIAEWELASRPPVFASPTYTYIRGAWQAISITAPVMDSVCVLK